MAEKTISLEKVESLTNCSICLSKLIDARLLPCHHSLCFSCLKLYVDKFTRQGQFPCPICNYTCVVPSSGPERFPKNFIAATLEDAVEVAREPTEEKHTCSFDKCGNDGIYYCKGGCNWLCSTCHNYHGKFNSEHQVVPAAEMNKAEIVKSAESCLRHNQPISLYCTQCSVTGCATCFFLEHREHHCRDIEQVAEESMLLIQDMIQRVQLCVKKVEQESMVTRQVEQTSQKDFKETQKLVLNLADHLHRRVNNCKETLLKIVGLAEEEMQDKIAQCDSQQGDVKAALERLSSHHESLLRQGNATNIMSQLKCLITETTENVEKNISQVRWKCNVTRSNEFNMEQPLGVVDLKITDGEMETTKTAAPVLNPEHHLRVRLVSRVTLTEKDIVTAMVVDDTDVRLMHRGSYRLWSYTKKDLKGRNETFEEIYDVHKLVLTKMTQAYPGGGGQDFNALLVIEGNPDKVTVFHFPGLSMFHTRDLPSSSYFWGVKTKLLMNIMTMDRKMTLFSASTQRNEKCTITTRSFYNDVHPWLVSECNGGFVVLDKTTPQIVWVNEKGDTLRRRDCSNQEITTVLSIIDGRELNVLCTGNEATFWCPSKDGFSVYGFSLQDDPVRCHSVDFEFTGAHNICVDSDGRNIYVVQKVCDSDLVEMLVFESLETIGQSKDRRPNSSQGKQSLQQIEQTISSVGHAPQKRSQRGGSSMMWAAVHGNAGPRGGYYDMRGAAVHGRFRKRGAMRGGYIGHHARYAGDIYNLQQITPQETVIPQVIPDTNEDQHGYSRSSENTDSAKMTSCILNVHLPGGIIP